MGGLSPDPGWTLDRRDGALLLSAGADLRYSVPDVPPAVAEEVLAAWRAACLDRSRLSAGAVEVLDQLATAGALRLSSGSAALPLATIFVGTPVDGLGPAGGDPDAAGAVVLVRTTGTWADVVQRAAAVGVPHLVVDGAYHHTLSLGPLVVPGQTACAGCLAGRITARWGDERPPAAPAAAHAPVAAAIVAHEAARLAAGTSRLVNRTVAVDLDTWRTVEQALLRLPWCRCSAGAAARTGPMELPWAAAER
ncbi:MAG: hypothetical protein ACLGI2_12735 [Acidimicrobiia bacterium]